MTKSGQAELPLYSWPGTARLYWTGQGVKNKLHTISWPRRHTHTCWSSRTKTDGCVVPGQNGFVPRCTRTRFGNGLRPLSVGDYHWVTAGEGRSWRNIFYCRTNGVRNKGNDDSVYVIIVKYGGIWWRDNGVINYPIFTTLVCRYYAACTITQAHTYARIPVYAYL